MRKSERIPFRVQPMLAMQVKEPFQRPGWVYEEKYDGYRLLAYKEGRRVTLLSRAAHDRTRTFPDIKAAVAGLKPRTLLLDGELVAFDRNHVSRFQLLQDGDAVPVYAVFDCLYIDGHDLRSGEVEAAPVGVLTLNPPPGQEADVRVHARVGRDRGLDVA